MGVPNSEVVSYRAHNVGKTAVNALNGEVSLIQWFFIHGSNGYIHALRLAAVIDVDA